MSVPASMCCPASFEDCKLLKENRRSSRVRIQRESKTTPEIMSSFCLS
jgi:hypothetical protein